MHLKFEIQKKTKKILMGNDIRKNCTKFHGPSSIRSGRKVGGTKSRNKKKKERKKKIHFLAPNRVFSKSSQKLTISNFDM